MTDPASARLTAGGSRVRRTRGQGPSRNSSARSSAIYNDDYVQSQGYGHVYGSLGLRSTASRYSLNDQFAATRQEFEFGFDDGASTYDRSTIASGMMSKHHEDENDSAFLPPITDYYDPIALQERQRVIDPYDLLVLPQNPSARDIRRAYFRLFVLFYPDTHPPRSRRAASVYFTLVQDAFERLICPDRQLVQGLDEVNTFDLVLDEPGRYQVYQLWDVLGGAQNHSYLNYESRQDDDNDEQREGDSIREHYVLKRVGKIGSSLHRLQTWVKNGSLGLGVKLDMGSPRLFESGAAGFSRFSTLNRQLLSLVPIHVAPRLEASYRLPASIQSPIAQGLWTFSTALEPQAIGASIKYGIDVAGTRGATQFINAQRSREQLIRKASNGVRIEAELSSGFLWSKVLALRCLKRIGRFSRLGFEVGFSTYHLHLSLYWSRLGQRIRLPFLLSFGSPTNTRFLFWVALAPFLGLAAWDLVSRRRQVHTSKLHEKSELIKLVQDRRGEADDITILLSANVENRQDTERANRGLVILSAKYGVKKNDSWGLEEVADVTTAVAALVDDGQLRIPSSVDKTNILGFWDPVPGVPKTLHVRYIFQGTEATREVAESEELLLPMR
ncbi:hypothetical protein SUNI508_01882 [Seiridium unicorne]|uniref:J domain-containing protein n=1 Tax=Seiridium unicorne TaxID=138068 RepID=A0ABR2UP96_9PEZI